MSTLSTAHAADVEDPSAQIPPVSGGGDVGASGRLRRQRRRRRRRQRPIIGEGSSETVTDGSFRFTESEAENNPSWQSPVGSTSTAGVGGDGSFDGSTIHGVSGYLSSSRIPRRKESWDNDEELDLESGELELMKAMIYATKEEEDEKECRICHLSLLEYDSNNDNGGAIELGCDCKGDLGTAHKQCADTWFKIRGNTTCEICGAIASNIAGEQTIEASNNTTAAASVASTAPSVFMETRTYLNGRRIMNFLLGCMVFAFVISWLFHFNVLP